MAVVVNSIELENFKSFKRELLNLSPLTVLLGPNGSGKTNALEGIKLAFDLAAHRTPTDYPFTPFWGYSNAVHNQDDTNFIGFKFDLKIETFHVTYASKVTGVGGSLRFLEETIWLENFLELRREGSRLFIKYDENFWKTSNANKAFQERLTDLHDFGEMSLAIKKKNVRDTSGYQVYERLDESKSIFSGNLFLVVTLSLGLKKIRKYDVYFLSFAPSDSNLFVERRIPIFLPLLERRSLSDSADSFVNQNPLSLLYAFFSGFAVSGFTSLGSQVNQGRGVVFIRHDSIHGMKQSVPINYHTEGILTGESALIWLFKYFNHYGKLPERIQHAVNDLFPGWRISFRTTYEGNITLQVIETDQFGRQQILSPPSLPEGFLKLLLLLSVIEMKPGMLLIDESENSLHERILEYLLDSLRDSGINSILTTHSPLVVDDVNLSEIRILERDSNGSKIRSIKKPLELKKKLLELGITPSDFWLYGEFA